MKRCIWVVALCLVVLCAGTAQAGIDFLQSRTFPVGTLVIPLDDKMPLAERINALGMLYNLNKQGVTYYRIIQPPGPAVMKTNLYPGGTSFAGGPALVEGAIPLVVQAMYPGVMPSVQTLTEAFSSDMVLGAVTAPKIFLIKNQEIDYGMIQNELTAMKVDYDWAYNMTVAADPTIMDSYDLIIDDCPGFGGYPWEIPQNVIDYMRAKVEVEGAKIKFTDIALKDMVAAFPGFVTIGPNTEATWPFTIDVDPYSLEPGKGESLSQFYGPNPVGVWTKVKGYTMVQNLQPTIVRTLMFSNAYGIPPAYRIAAAYWPFGKGLVEGYAYHVNPQEQPDVADRTVLTMLLADNFILKQQITPPSCTLSANPTVIDKGSSSTLTWTSTNATSAVIDHGVGSVTPVGGGSTSVSPTATTYYTMTVYGPDGTATCHANVEVRDVNPTCSLQANPGTINPGGSSTLTWTSTNGVSAAITPTPGSVPLNGSTSVSPASTTTYTLTVTGAPGTTPAVCPATVTVNAPPTCTLTADPTAMPRGQSSLLTWTSTNGASWNISPGIGSVPANGSGLVAPLTTTTYTFTVVGPAGTAVCPATVTVYQPPECLSFTATPGEIFEGDSSTLAWNTSNATTAKITPDGSAVALPGGSKIVSPASTTTYVLDLTGPGGSASCPVTVTVNPRPPCVNCYMNGGGKLYGIFMAPNRSMLIDFGFLLHCDRTKKPNWLNVVWYDKPSGITRNFRLTDMTSVACTDNPAYRNYGGAGFDTLQGSGTGTLNYWPGYRAEWTLTDISASGVGIRDTFSITIYDAMNNKVLEASGPVVVGGNAAHGQ